jgi:hypothetical protein
MIPHVSHPSPASRPLKPLPQIENNVSHDLAAFGQGILGILDEVRQKSSAKMGAKSD